MRKAGTLGWKWPGDRAWRHVEYDNYITREVIPLTQRNPNPFMIVIGASFGAYQAMNFSLRHPDLVGRVLAMNGLYDIRDWTDGHYDDNVYFNNPVDFVKNENDPARLAQIKRHGHHLDHQRDRAAARRHGIFLAGSMGQGDLALAAHLERLGP